MRYGLTQVTHGSIGEERSEQVLRELEVPLLFAKHEGCLGETDEGFEDAAAGFPDAHTASDPEAPSVSSEFAVALRNFVESVVGEPSAVRDKREAR